MAKTKFSLFAIVVVACSIYNSCNAHYIEPACISQGGICLLVNECPDGLLTSTKGLCPVQQKQGVECCYGSSIHENRCGHRGGECMPAASCGQAPQDLVAINCPNSEVCCILL